MLHGIKANKFTRRAFLRRLLLFWAGHFVFTLKGKNCDSQETPSQVAETPFLSLVFRTPVQSVCIIELLLGSVLKVGFYIMKWNVTYKCVCVCVCVELLLCLS